MPDRSNDRIVIVGGAGGIGSAIVSTYLERGLRVVIVDQVCAAEWEDSNRLEFICTDVLSLKAIAQMRSKLAEDDGTVTHLVSLAGGAIEPEFGRFESIPQATIRRSIDLNLTSHLHIVQSLLSLIERDHGKDKSVTLVSSINALCDFGLPAYSAAKAGLIGFVRSMTSELGRRGIRINALLPGTIQTPGTSNQPKDFDALRRGAALGRLTRPEEIGSLVYAITHMMTCVTGQEIVADCGQSITTVSWRLSLGDRKDTGFSL